MAIITQSGALGIAMIGKTAVENIGLSAIVSVGNETDVDEADLLEYLIQNPRTKIILMYIEGVRDGERLIQTLKRVTEKIPVVVIKSGRSERGAIAAASHTGCVAGSDEIFDAIIRQCGVTRAESVEEAFNWCKFLSNSPPPPGENTVIITNGGGIGVMATDACEKFGVKLYDDTNALKVAFATVTPDFGSTKNPVDLTGQAGAVQYDSALSEALKNDQIHAVIALYCETAVSDAENLAAMISGSMRTVYAYLSNPFPDGFNFPPGRSLGAATNIGLGIGESNFDAYKNSLGQQWNLNIQHELPGNMVAEIGYLRNRGIGLVDGDGTYQYNQLPASSLSLGSGLLRIVENPFYGIMTNPTSSLSRSTVEYRQLLRPWPQYTSVGSFRKPRADSIYHGMTIRVDKRFSHGWQLSASCVYSRSG